MSADATTTVEVVKLLSLKGLDKAVVTVLEAMGGPRERIRAATAGAFALDRIEPLNMLAIEISTEARGLSLVPGRADHLFDHDGQITKSEVRAATLARLAPRPGEMLWDIGAGSGSIAIEWLLTHPANRAVAVERDRARVARIRQTPRRSACRASSCPRGSAPEALAGLPPPEAIFVAAARRRRGSRSLPRGLRPRGRMVVNAVTIGDSSAVDRAFGRHGGCLTMLSVAHADAIGGFHGWRPAMPVTQWAWIKP